MCIAKIKKKKKDFAEMCHIYDKHTHCQTESVHMEERLCLALAILAIFEFSC